MQLFMQQKRRAKSQITSETKYTIPFAMIRIQKWVRSAVTYSSLFLLYIQVNSILMALKTEGQSLVFQKGWFFEVSAKWDKRILCIVSDGYQDISSASYSRYIPCKLVFTTCAINKYTHTHTHTHMHAYTHSRRNPPNVKQNPDLNLNQNSFIYCGEELAFLYVFYGWILSSPFIIILLVSFIKATEMDKELCS